MPIRRPLILALAVCAGLCEAPARQLRVLGGCDLSPLTALPGVWRMTPDDLEAAFTIPGSPGKRYFRWLTEDRSRALFYRRVFPDLHIGLELFDEKLPAEEVIVDFEGGTVSEVRVSVWNQGDSGELSGEAFGALFKTCGRRLGEILEAKPSPRPADTKTGIEVKGYRWINRAKGAAYLEHNPEALAKAAAKPEYLRIRLFPRPYAQTSMRRIQLAGQLRREDDGTQWIPGVPMVDQGTKGYCVVASCQRVFEYYRIPIDQHQIAPLFGTDAEDGTNTRDMEKSLAKVAGKFHTKFTRLWFKGTRSSEFAQVVRSNIDEGVPLLWCWEVEKEGAHMSLIIGYNAGADTLVYTDSWGRGHERKTITFGDAEPKSYLLHRFEPTF